MKHYAEFTALIPAGGRGSRFDKHINKLLFKIKNKTIFEMMLDKIVLLTDNIVIVTSKTNDIGIKTICNLNKYCKINFKFVLQKEPNGMGFAVKLAVPKIKTNYFFLIWADQLGISSQTMVNTLDNFLLKTKHAIVFPTIKKTNPYTLIIKNKFGNVIDVLQSRETSINKNYGETDCGFFVCNTLIVSNFIKKLVLNKKIITQRTKEYDFLKSFRFIAKNHLISTNKAKNLYESKGVNTKKDLLYLLKIKKI